MIYTNFTTAIAPVPYSVEAEMQQSEDYLARPVGNRLAILFHRWDS